MSAAIKSTLKRFLSPAGRIGRKGYWIHFAAFIGFLLVMNFLIGAVKQQGALEFWLGLTYFILFFFILYSVYGKRLHDIGRSLWPVTSCIVLTILILIAGMMFYGGSEYFSEFSQYDRKDTIDPARRDAITQAYETRLRESEKVLGPILSGLWIGFTLWLGVAKSDEKANRYGDAG